MTLDDSNKSESENIVNHVASINVYSFLRRKNKLFHTCVLKPLTDLNVDTLGELIQEYEYNRDPGLSERMKIVLGAIPVNLKLILENISENTKCNESLSSINLANKTTKDIGKVTTKEFQLILKKALKRISEPDFMNKLGLSKNFDSLNIEITRKMCKNTKLRSIFFRLIHNDFFTRVRMKKLKMMNSDECLRCGSPETTKHLLWECYQAHKVWIAFNDLLKNIGFPNDCVESYDKIYNHSSSAAITTIKIKTIQELIQIDRPTNWNKERVVSMALEIVNIEKYNSKVNNCLREYNVKWKEIEDNVYKYKLLSSLSAD